MSETRTQKTGTAAGVDINPNTLPFDHAVGKKVQLSADYILAHPPGFPSPPFMTGVAPGSLRKGTQTITSGTQIVLGKAEADALIAAGKATAV
jgi:hypothetical protein